MAHIEIDDFYKIFVHHVDGVRYSFNVSYLPEHNHDWFCEVVGRQMDEIHKRAVNLTENRVKREIREALGIK